MNNELKTIFRYIIWALIIVLAIKFFIWALPVILVLILIYYIYNMVIKTKNKVSDNINKEEKEVKKSKKITKTIDAEVIREKNEEK